MPPLWVQKLYRDTTLLIKRLTINSIDIDALKDIKRINNKIKVKSEGDKKALK
jgi:hypothetical protein